MEAGVFVVAVFVNRCGGGFSAHGCFTSAHFFAKSMQRISDEDRMAMVKERVKRVMFGRRFDARRMRMMPAVDKDRLHRVESETGPVATAASARQRRRLLLESRGHTVEASTLPRNKQQDGDQARAAPTTSRVADTRQIRIGLPDATTVETSRDTCSVLHSGPRPWPRTNLTLGICAGYKSRQSHDELEFPVEVILRESIIRSSAVHS